MRFGQREEAEAVFVAYAGASFACHLQELCALGSGEVAGLKDGVVANGRPPRRGSNILAMILHMIMLTKMLVPT
ncbi:hypothetical protein CKJ76_26000 [Mycobacterium avium]|nr:hypothetical protein CKJ76_26000 [Mycobacterium avium]